MTDIAPTLYELLGISAAAENTGACRSSRSTAPASPTPLRDGEAPTRKHTQYFELLGDRAIWHEGWKAVSRHVKGTDFDADRWELYHLDRDFAEIDDLAASEPDRLRALVDLWWVEAGKYGVLPLDDRDWERAAARLRMNTTTRYEYLGNMARVDRLSSPDISDRSYSIAAEFEPAAAVTEGVLLAWGSRFAGFVLYIKDGELRYEYVYSESIKYTLRAPFSPRVGQND